MFQSINRFFLGSVYMFFRKKNDTNRENENPLISNLGHTTQVHEKGFLVPMR